MDDEITTRIPLMRIRILTGIMRLAAKFDWTEEQLRTAMDIADGAK